MFSLMNLLSSVYSRYFCTCSNSSKAASALLYSGLLSTSLYPFGRSPYLMSLVQVSNISFAISYLFGIKHIPSNEIKLSLPQSKILQLLYLAQKLVYTQQNYLLLSYIILPIRLFLFPLLFYVLYHCLSIVNHYIYCLLLLFHYL